MIASVRSDNIKTDKNDKGDKQMGISNMFKKVVASGVIVSALIGGVAAAPSLVARAEQTNPPAQSSGTATRMANPIVGKGLARAFKVELRIQERQEKRLDGAGKIITRVEQVIDKATAAGKDVSAVKTALDAYKDAVSKAQGLHTAAGVILNMHAGFTDGKVTDAVAAKATVKGVGAKQKEFAKTLKQAHNSLKDALKEWKESNAK
jgi:hypothetical protein